MRVRMENACEVGEIGAALLNQQQKFPCLLSVENHSVLIVLK